MELDELKDTWGNQNNKEQHKNLTTKLIDQMTHKNYNSKINKITYPEIIGCFICSVAIIFIGLNFYKLDTSFLQVIGVIAISVLLTLSVISILSLRKLIMVRDFNKPYAETLKIFATQKLEFYKLQKINMILSYLLLVSVIILLPKFFNDKNISENKYFWIFSFSLGYIFLLFLSKIVAKAYKSTLIEAGELLQGLDKEV